RHLADIPEERDALAVLGEMDDLRVTREMQQGGMILGLLLADETRMWRPPFQAAQQALDAAKIEIGIAPDERRQGSEARVLHRFDDLALHLARFQCRAESAVGHVAASTAGDLRDLRLG